MHFQTATATATAAATYDFFFRIDHYCMIPESKYIDQIYNFKGDWDLPSVCGLKIIQKKDKTIVIATEFYNSNPGSSVTSRVDKLATDLINKFHIDHEKLIFIVHNPDRKSSLEFFRETFDRVHFEWDRMKLFNPLWERLTLEKVEELVKKNN